MPVGFTPTGALQVLAEFTPPILRKKTLFSNTILYTIEERIVHSENQFLSIFTQCWN